MSDADLRPSDAAPDVRQRRMQWLVPVPFITFALGVAIYGVVRHESGFWSAGISMLSVQGVMLLADRFVRDYDPPATGLERFAAAIKGAFITTPIMLAVTIGFWLLFPNWFPDACPIPPR